MCSIEKKTICGIQTKILAWYKDNQREFPWRSTKNPYEILIAEKLLQQTKARKLVVDIYLRFIELYPNPNSLAQANLMEVKNLISPLGLVYRAKELIEMANELLIRHDGVVPDDLQELLSLTGIGNYCARAVLCFAYGEEVEVVDTNIARFLYRVNNLPGKLPSNPARNKPLLEKIHCFIPKEKAKEFYFAILDLCEKVCKAKKPNCKICPILSLCGYEKKNFG